MAKSKNIVGEKFGKLIVISRKESELVCQKSPREISVWECECDCGNIVLVKGRNLHRSNNPNCGCEKQYGKSLRPGFRIDKLTTVSYKSGKWLCICDCGNNIELKTSQILNKRRKHFSCGCKEIIIKYPKPEIGKTYGLLKVLSKEADKWICLCSCEEITYTDSYSLSSGTKKSCGCLVYKKHTEEQNRAKSKIKMLRTYEDSCVNIVYSQYKRNAIRKGRNFDLSIDQFRDYISCNCYYCGSEPNIVQSYINRLCDDGKDVKNFVRNTLDRVNSNFGYTWDNAIPSCLICNRAKSSKHIEKFIDFVMNLEVKSFDDSYIENIEIIDYENDNVKSSAKFIYSKKYADGDLDLKTFYSLSGLSCFYCGRSSDNSNGYNFDLRNVNKDDRKLSGYYNIENGYFKYNGLDRIDSSLPHNRDNCVPCCKTCNWSKGSLSLDKYNEWIKRFQQYQKEKAQEKPGLKEANQAMLINLLG